RYVWRGRGPNYFITSVLHRDANDLNICDSFRYFMDSPPPTPGLVMQIDEKARVKAAALLAQYGISPRDYIVCFQLGASDRDKRWPEERFAQLAKLLVERYNARIILLGVESEAPLGKKFEEYAPGTAVHLFGKTSIAQVAAILERSRTLVTNDTGTMHIAAAMRCPIVLISVGYVHFRETGPYGAGHCAIEVRRDDAGRSDMRGRDTAGAGGILAEHALRAVELLMTATPGSIPALDDDATLAHVDMHWSSFAPDGCLQWYPVIRRAATNADVIRMAYRPMWLDYFDSKRDRQNELESIQQIAKRYDSLDDPTFWINTQDALNGLAEICDKGARMTLELITMLSGKGPMRQAQTRARELMALDEDTRVYAELNRACKPLVAIARFERDNMEGADPTLLAKTTLTVYENTRDRARALSKKLQMAQDALGS
ncbi:MAG: glycosyltransferase family 9 protein, partial [Candidatus Hydrogenedentes bacterium]|nr:glycosyltransferase family 9 protein [Candidatus Hydrogenedentota bacterium]